MRLRLVMSCPELPKVLPQYGFSPHFCKGNASKNRAQSHSCRGTDCVEQSLACLL